MVITPWFAFLYIKIILKIFFVSASDILSYFHQMVSNVCLFGIFLILWFTTFLKILSTPCKYVCMYVCMFPHLLIAEDNCFSVMMLKVSALSEWIDHHFCWEQCCWKHASNGRLSSSDNRRLWRQSEHFAEHGANIKLWNRFSVVQQSPELLGWPGITCYLDCCWVESFSFHLYGCILCSCGAYILEVLLNFSCLIKSNLCRDLFRTSELV